MNTFARRLATWFLANGVFLCVAVVLITQMQRMVGRMEKENTLPLARAWERQGLLDHATAAFEHILAYNPRDEESWLRLGRLYARGGRYSDSIETSTRARELSDAVEVRSAALLLEARMWRSLGRTGEAAHAIRAALAVDPTSPEAHHEAARIARQQGDYPAMAESLQSMARHLDGGRGSDAFLAHIARERAIVAETGDRPLEALTPFQRYRLGVALCELGAWERAEEAFRAAITSGDAPGDAFFRAGVVAMVEGDKERAGRLFEEALSRVPTHAESLRVVGRAEPEPQGRPRDRRSYPASSAGARDTS